MKHFIDEAFKFDASRIRIPCDHPELDALDLRIRDLLLSGTLTEGECGILAKGQRRLHKLDRPLARWFPEKPLPPTECRPLLPDEWSNARSPYWGLPMVEVMVGWVFRLAEYVQRLEAKYGVVSTCDGGDDDLI